MKRTCTYLALILVTSLLGLPFYWMVLTSLKSPAEATTFPPTWLPNAPSVSNFSAAWHVAPFGRFYLNSIVVATVTTLLQVTFALLMAYAFAFIRFPAKISMLLMVIATMMIPEEMKLIPNFLLLSRLGWIDTYPGLIVPAIAHAFPVFVLYQQFRQLPTALLDAAHIDGASHIRILIHVAIPIARPVLAAVTIISLLGQWNAYLWPLIVTNSTAMRTLPLGIAFLRKQAEDGTMPWNILMGAAVFVVIPMVILYTIAQKQFVEGITRGALKS